ncbi:MAG: hypothetical protein DLM56_05550 [Pseudonocardiales bacterium]|nr:MAG: hypothetical protein DLM56_05550 [Pseudonocardiales bacterium]
MSRAAGPTRDATPDAHLFPTRPYDLVKEFVIALVVMGALTVLLVAVFSSPDRKAVSLRAWARAAPSDVVATATAELAGTSTSATYGAPYNTAGPGQDLGPLHLQRWGGVRIPIHSARDLVLTPLQTVSGDTALATALTTYQRASTAQQTKWASSYADALAAVPDGDPAKAKPGSYGPVPILTSRFLTLASSGGLEGVLTTSNAFYGSNETKPLLPLTDGTYLEGQARADHLGGDQWGMMNETGNYPGQPWMWLYTFWYQVKPFATSGNADALVWGLMAALTLVLIFVPYIPGLRALPRHLGVHRLIWRDTAARRSAK